MLAERFAFCQTMPMDEFLTTAEALRKSGYRPMRFRPYADGKSLQVTAVWTRDGRPWRMAHDRTSDEVRQSDEQNRKEGYLPVDVAGYVAAGGDEGKPTSRFAALWALRTRPDDDARLVVASSAAELTKVQARLEDVGLLPLALHAWRQADDQLSYSGVWHTMATGTPARPPSGAVCWKRPCPAVVDRQEGPLIDLDLSAAPPPPSTKGRAAAALQAAEATLKAKPDDLNARFARASAHFQQGENQKAIDDLNVVIEKAPKFVTASQFRSIAHARLGHKDQARADLERFQKGNATERQKLYLAVIVAAELGEGTDKALETLEEALKKQPQDSMLHYDAACACALASQALAGKDQAKGRELAERAIRLLRTAIQNGYADYKHMQEDTDLDPLRETPGVCRDHEGRASGPLLCRRLDGRCSVRGDSTLWSRSRRPSPALPGTGVTGLSHGGSHGRPDFSTGTVHRRLGLAPPCDLRRDEGPTCGTSSSGGDCSPSHGEGG